MSFLRARTLRIGTGARVALIALQPSPRGLLGRKVIHLLGPDLVLTPSIMLLEELRRLGVHAEFIPMGVDHHRFMPVPDETSKKQLRRLYGLPEDGRLILHVGHLQRGRNLGWLSGVREATGATVLVVAGSAAGRDARVATEMDDMGIEVLGSYLPRVEEVYQLADAYTFPVQEDRAAIGVPLSVLEAMACNLPVVSTPFGGLPRMFVEGNGLFFANDPARFASLTDQALKMPRTMISTRHQALRYTWPHVIREIVGLVADLG